MFTMAPTRQNAKIAKKVFILKIEFGFLRLITKTVYRLLNTLEALSIVFIQCEELRSHY